MQALVSVIMPIYNAELTLENTLNSIVSQSLYEIQIILVNDGSTDNSLDICRKFKNKDSRILIVNKKNGGVASARQAGLEKATGKYIIHADADDFVPQDAYQRLYEKAENTQSDIVIGNFIVSGKHSKRLKINMKENSDPEFLIKSILKGDVHGSLWNKLIKNNLYKNQKFICGLDFMEDVLMLVNIIPFSDPKIFILGGQPVYEYKYRSNSYTNNLSLAYLNKGKKAIEKVEEILNSSKINYHEEIKVIKLRMKISYLLNTNSYLVKVKDIFPEINKSIFTIPCMPFRFKLLVFFEHRNIHFFSLAYKNIRNLWNYLRRR